MDGEAVGDRKAAQSMNFEQFHALRNRRRNKAANNATETGEQEVDEAKETAGEDKGNAAERVRLSETVGDFVEMHEVQLIVILLVVADVLAVALELYIELGAMGQSGAVQRLSSLLDAFTGFTIFFFLIELGLSFFAFGEAALLHAGYVLDTVVVVLALYWEVNLQSKSLRLLGIVRVWRAVRLVNGMVSNAYTERDKVMSQLSEARVAVSELELERERAEQALRREMEAKHRVEKQVQGYKDMNETLHEALSIAAHNAAEHQFTEGGADAFLKDLADEKKGGGEGEANESSLDQSSEAPAGRKFEVMTDGSFKEKTVKNT